MDDDDDDDDDGLSTSMESFPDGCNTSTGWVTRWRESKAFFLLVLCCAIVTDSLLYGAIVPLLPMYRQLYGFSTFGIGALFVCFGVFQLLATIPSGLACDRWGPRKVLNWGLVLLFVSTMLFAVARSALVIVLARCAQGAVAALTWTASLTAIPLALPTTEQGSASTLLNAVAGLGVLLGPIVGGSLYEAFGVGGPYYVLAGLVCVDGLLRALLSDAIFDRRAASRLIETGMDAGSGGADTAAAEPGDGEDIPEPGKQEKRGKLALIRRMLSDRSVLALLFGALLASGAFATFETLTPLHLADTFHLTPLYIGLLYAVVPLAFTIMSPIAGWLSDHYPQYRRYQLVFGLWANGVCMAVVSLPRILWLQITIMAVTGLTSAFTVSTGMPELNRICEVRFGADAFGTMSGVQNALWSLGGTLLPLFASGIASTALGASAAMALCGLVMFVAGFVILFVAIVGNTDPKTLYSGYGQVATVEAPRSSDNASTTQIELQDDSDELSSAASDSFD